MLTVKITELKDIEAVIKSCRYCVVSMADGGEPYSIPMCFAYRDGVLYLHSAPNGRKIEILKRNSGVSIVWTEVMKDFVYQDKEVGCSYSMQCKSIWLRDV
jgi:nitroimidazol reductase NimA-like FMN-containing flavoprotein (pyridoxamine 5'-phosphate oxidase superfamily)